MFSLTFRHIIFHFILLFGILANSIHGNLPTCKKTGPCTCELDDGGTVDLTPLGSKDGKPRWQDVKGADLFLYSYNPCFPFTEPTTSEINYCKEAAACQAVTFVDEGREAPDRYNLGTQDSATFKVTASGETAGTNNFKMNITYKKMGKDELMRTTDVIVSCGQTENFEALGDTDDSDELHFAFKLTTSHACPKSPGGGGLSIGSILLIVFFVLVAVYLVGGILYMKYRKGATGLELIPNRTFWVAIPGLVKDGVVLVISPLRKGGKTYESI